MFPLAEWMPDQPDLSAAGSEAKNCVWLDGVYKPQGGKRAVITTAFPDDCRGAQGFKLVDTLAKVYAGSADKLYERTGVSWTDISARAYTLDLDQYWEFSQYGTDIFAANNNEPLQIRSGGSGNFADVADGPYANRIWSLRNFLMTGDIIDGVDSFPYRVRWSAINDGADWPVPGTSDAEEKQAGEQDLPSIFGRVRAIRGSEYTLIFQDKAITRASYVGAPIVWQFDTIDRERGAISASAVVQVGRQVFFIAEDGFFVTDGTGASRPIGYGKVDRWFRNYCDYEKPSKITAAANPARKLVYWMFKSTESASQPDHMIVYNYAEEKWTHLEMGGDFLFSAVSPGYTLEELDSITTNLDDLEISLDSDVWLGGGGYLAIIDEGIIYALDGDNLSAVVETGEIESGKGRSFVSGVKPYTDGTCTVQLGTRDAQTSSVTWSGAATVNSRSRKADFRSDARYHRIRLNISSFTEAFGVDVDMRPTGAV